MKKSHKYFLPSFITSLLLLISLADLRAQGFEMGDLEDLRGKLEEVERGETLGEIEPEDPFIIDKDRSLEIERDEFMSEYEFEIERPLNFDQKPATRSLALTIKPFGYDFFSKASSTFAPATDIPIPPGYILGPGDNVRLFLFGNVNEEYSLQISREGQIFLPEIGAIFLAGMTFSEAKNVINERVSNQMIGTDALITLGELRSMRVFILGDAYQPGSYIVSGLSTLSNALFISGGVSLSGSLRNIEHKRGGKTIAKFDLYDLLLRGDTTNDTRLQDGDVIYIPPVQKRVSITGEVNRPGMYEIKTNENIEDLISYSGGLKSSADLRRVSIDTINDGRLSLEGMNLNNKDSMNKVPKNGDIVHIFPVINNYDDAILLSNYLRNQGFVAWKEGIKVADLIEPSYDLLNDTDRRYVLVKRMNKQTGRLTFLQANLEEINGDNDQDSNLSLMKNDELFFFQKLEKDIDDTERPEDEGLDRSNFELMDSDMLPAVSARSRAIEDPTDRYSMESREMLYGEESEYYSDDKEDEDEANYSSRYEIIEGLVEQIEAQSSPTEPSRTVNILGLRYPGKYPHTKNMKLSGVIDAAGGLPEGASLSEVEYIKTSIINNQQVFNKSVVNIANKKNLNLLIEPGSFLIFKTALKEPRIVSIEGEVVFPGDYVIEQDETLSELIKRAGGLKSTANPDAAFFTRRNLKEIEKKRIEEAGKLLQQQVLFSQLSNDIGSRSIAGLDLFLQTDEIDDDALGRIVIDLNQILATGLGDVALEDGDKIRIPRFSNIVSVIGEVNVPSTHLFDSKKDISDYISMSGMVNQLGDDSNIYIIAANGSIKRKSNSGFFRGSSGLEPGDTIVVPVMVDTFSNIQAVNEVTQVIYQLAVAAAAVSSF